MLMQNTAHADMIPGLEIDANDVVAGHGATVGQIDEEQLFYLRARGIPEPKARQMIIEGFYETLFRKVKDVTVRERFWEAVRAKVAG
jgi:Fe-S cluster assembly protein SufD